MKVKCIIQGRFGEFKCNRCGRVVHRGMPSKLTDLKQLIEKLQEQYQECEIKRTR